MLEMKSQVNAGNETGRGGSAITTKCHKPVARSLEQGGHRTQQVLCEGTPLPLWLITKYLEMDSCLTLSLF